MDNFIPLFPLKLVIFPGEQVNLHVFEPRYKELIADVMTMDRKFGIPSFVSEKIDFGTLIEIHDIKKIYPDGRMDIQTFGLQVFRVLNFKNPANGKKYAKGNVEYILDHAEEDPYMKGYLMEKLDRFFTLVTTGENVTVNENTKSFEVIHHLGLTLEEEYTLLSMNYETQRQQYIIDYLDKSIPLLERAQKAKNVIKMNGDYRYLDPIHF